MAVLSKTKMEIISTINYLISCNQDSAATKIFLGSDITIVDVLTFHSRSGNGLNVAMRDVRVLDAMPVPEIKFKQGIY